MSGTRVSLPMPDPVGNGSGPDPIRTAQVLKDLMDERFRQHETHGDQSHLPDGTGGTYWERLATIERMHCERAFMRGSGTYRHILAEEVAEAFAESDPALLRAELVQVAAVAVQWIEAIDKREAK
jgi:hypothetical protein